MIGYKTKYNPSVAWSTIASNVVQLSRATGSNPATYRVYVSALDTQEIGAGTKAKGDYFTDNLGFPYYIFNVDTAYIDVEDNFNVGHCPTAGKIGYVHKSAYKNQSLFLPSFAFRKLHPLAQSNNNVFVMALLWANDPNTLAIPFTATKTPTISNWQSDQTINGKTVNLAEDYGERPKFCIEITISVTEKRYYYKEPKKMNLIDGLLDNVIFDIVTPASGFILVSN